MDLRLTLFGEDKASSAFDSVGSAARQAAKLLFDFSKESLKAAQDQEKADRQLALAAKGLTAAFKEQASAIQSQLGVQDDMVQGIQALLLQFGEAPDKVDGTTRAILDFSAATGQDAMTAARTLTAGIESGKGAFKEYGVQLKLTGKASEDLGIATEALRVKFGGAAQNDANSLEGQVRLLSTAFGELQESFGGWIMDVATSSGILEELKATMSGITSMFAKPDLLEQMGAQRKELALVKQGIAAYGRGEISAEMIGNGAAPLGSLMSRQRELEGLLSSGEQQLLHPSKGLPGLGGADRTTNKGLKMAKGGGSDGPSFNDVAGQNDEFDQQLHEQNLKRLAAEEEFAVAIQQQNDEFDVQITEWQEKRHEKELKELEKHNEKIAREQKQLQDKVVQQEQQWAQVGATLGSAVVNAFGAEMAKMADGGEFDVVEFFAKLLPVVLGTIGSFFGPVGTAIGGALGSLGGMGLSALNASGKTKAGAPVKRHFGGWIDAAVPRFHGGGWMGGDERPAILQTGERVLSRGEVARMGGQAGVDAAARGGGGRGGITINVSSLDSRSTAEFFTDRGGKGLNDAVRTGQGALAKLFGKGRLY